jgi:hypothetical protein
LLTLTPYLLRECIAILQVWTQLKHQCVTRMEVFLPIDVPDLYLVIHTHSVAKMSINDVRE